MTQEQQATQEQQSLPLPDSDGDVKSSNQELIDAMNLLEAPAEEMSAEEALAEPEQEVVSEEQEEAAKVEASDESEEVPEEVQDERLSGGWAKLMQMHSKVQTQATELKNKERQIEQYVDQAKELNQLSELAKSDPIAFLERQGIDYEKAFNYWTNRINGDESSSDFKSSASKEDVNATIEKQVQERIAREMANYRNLMEAERWINESEVVLQEDKYEPLRILEAEDEVAKLAAMYLQNGKKLTPREAADLLLPEANERLRHLSEKVARVSPIEQIQEPVAAKKGRTLSNSMSESVPASIRDDEPGSDYQELQKALKLVRNH